jgi:transposase InsO family protein
MDSEPAPREARRTMQKIPLPRDWQDYIQNSLLQAIALARVALTDVWSGFENGPLVCAQQAARIARLETQLALLGEELRIKDARMARIAPRARPHYPPCERLAILMLRAAAGWNAAETARRFLVTATTIASWMKRLDEGGEEALLRTAAPVNRFPDYVAALVAQLKVSLPGAGKRRIADMLGRAGLQLGATTVRRFASTKVPPNSPTGGDRGSYRSGEDDGTPTSDAQVAAAPEAPRPKAAERGVKARFVHHVWHVDLTVVPTVFGCWVPWWPFSVFLHWPFCWWVAAVMDQHSRAIVARIVLGKEPDAAQICAMLDRAVLGAGTAPRHIISDQGAQFQSEYIAWCKKRGSKPRFGAIGKHGSIAVLERFWRSMKEECFRRIAVPLEPAAMEAELDAYLLWYAAHRPHGSLGGATPGERLAGVLPANQRPGLEPRARYPLARGDPAVPLRRRVQGELRLVVRLVEGRKHLPIVELREAA